MATDVVDQGSGSRELSEAVEFASVRFAEWRRNSVICAEHLALIQADYRAYREQWQKAS